MTKVYNIITYVALLLLFLVCGVFWGNWLAISRSYNAFSIQELSHIARVVVQNLETPMTVLSGFSLLLLSISLLLHRSKASIEFYLKGISLILIICSILITTLVEVPINEQVVTWTPDNAPTNWESVRNKWMFFNTIRTIASTLSFILFSYAVVNPLNGRK